jgi:predicted Zn-dependent protease
MKSGTLILPLVLGAILCTGAERGSLKVQYPGKVADCQGVCSLRAKSQDRWTPIAQGMLLDKGDWIRTDARGANVLEVRLAGGDKVIVGPGSQIELIDKGEVSLIRGEASVIPAGKSELTLGLPKDVRKDVRSPTMFRATEDGFTQLESEPNWLKYFKGVETHESMGALVAKVEGRDLPLTIGYHKVTVDIRDQIARTVIEESFVNHTDSRLEGIFYFPLPQDASISGFAMWIGDELVEADVVEKQRAREIYETILREKRDPGLLEWTGGNIFKARVFPIFAHSEKRIKITYTQVLPMTGSRYSYSYALQSEMLKQTPLRELALKVTVSSALPLKSVVCPSHNARLSTTSHSAEVEFAAQEYTPSRDFEVEIETDSRKNELAIIPHRRGDDGYFLLTVNPPDADPRARPLLGDGAPLDLLVVADTSASMDREQRKIQDQFLSYLLGSLGKKDRFRLAAADAGAAWYAPSSTNASEPVVPGIAPTEDTLGAARAFLDSRVSLGWTDMAKVAADVFKQASANMHIIFIGDCVDTAGDGDPSSTAKALKRIYEEAGGKGTVHAVATGSSFEPAIVKALASLGGGSFRRLEGENPARTGAMNLLEELTRPGLRNMKVEFKGLRTARVYPEELPNLPAGRQQIILGRYLPEGADQKGMVIVTGERGGKMVKYEAPVILKDAVSGNAFIPRLWARLHLDMLLGQGQTPEVKADVIALSEEYYIMTPYTSFLVLESDADRERFGVTRRFKMRDGERFFADGRDAAKVELRRKQMLLAGEWRQDLRRQTLRELMTLGRNVQFYQQPQRQDAWAMNGPGAFGGAYKEGAVDRGPVVMRGIHASRASSAEYSLKASISSEARAYKPGGESGGRDRDYDGDESKRGLDNISDLGFDKGAEGLEGYFDANTAVDAEPDEEKETKRKPMADRAEPLVVGQKELSARQSLPSDGKLMMKQTGESRRLDGVYDKRSADLYSRRSYSEMSAPSYANQWLSRVFPYLVPVAPEVPVPSQWPEEAHNLSQGLLRQDKLELSAGGLKIRITLSGIDARSSKPTSQTTFEGLFSPKAWVRTQRGDGGLTTVEWCDGQQRGVYAPCFQAGRRRPAAAGETRLLSGVALPGYYDFSLSAMERSYATTVPAITDLGDGKMLVTLRYPNNVSYEVRLLVDTNRHVLLQMESSSDGRLQGRTTFSEFVQVAGCWWATTVSTENESGKEVSRTKATISRLDAPAFEKELAAAMAGAENGLLLVEPFRDPPAALQAERDKKPSFDDYLTLISMDLSAGQPEKAAERWAKAKLDVANKSAIDWLDIELLLNTRRNEEAKELIRKHAKKLAAAETADDLYLANSLYGLMSRCGQANVNERIGMLDDLKPVYARQPGYLAAMKTWSVYYADLLENAGRPEEALARRRELAGEYPRDINIQTRYFSALFNHGDIEQATAQITAVLRDREDWTRQERDSIRNSVCSQLASRMPSEAWRAFLEAWIAEDTTSAMAYQYYLSALLRLNKVEEMRAAMKKWIDEGVADIVQEGISDKVTARGESSQAIAARMQAALQAALGQGYNMYTEYVDPHWFETLAKTVKATAAVRAGRGYAAQIMGNGNFRRTDEARGLRRYFSDVLSKEAGTLPPDFLVQIIAWISGDSPRVDPEIWSQVAGLLEERWAKEQDPKAKNELSAPLLQVLGRCDPEKGSLRFLRRQVEEGPAEYRPGYLSALYNNLLYSGAWTTQREDEVFGLLPKLYTTVTQEQYRAELTVQQLCLCVDALLPARIAASIATPEEQGKMTRQELAAEMARARTAAKQGMAERLQQEAARQDPALAKWLVIERLYLEMQLNANPTNIAAECWELLPARPWALPAAVAEPARPQPRLDGGKDEPVQSWLELNLLDRCMTTLTCLAARRSADKALVARVSAYMDEGLKLAPEGQNEYWREQKYRLLVARDEPQALQAALRAWIAPGKADPRWQIVLGYLLAEQSKIPEAITQFEALQKDDALRPAELQALASWYGVVGDRAKQDAALLRAGGGTEEYQLSNRLYEYLRPLQQNSGATPGELDPKVAELFTALFRKAQQPAHYVNQLQQFYQYTHDERLLKCLPEGLTGHTAEQVYPFMQSLGGLLGLVRDEATVDRIAEHLQEVRKRVASQTDLRALDLLEVQIKRRAAEVANQPGPHMRDALAAMKRAFDREWQKGERRQMANLLANLGRIKQEELSREQLRELKELGDARGEPPEDRLQIQMSYAATLWSYEKGDEAIDALQSAVNEFRDVSGGSLPSAANSAVDRLIGYFEETKRFSAGEALLLKELASADGEQQKYWRTRRLLQLYVTTIRNKAEVSLGSGEALYRAAYGKMISELESADQNHRNAVVGIVCGLFGSTHDAGITQTDLRDFAFRIYPAVLEKQTDPNSRNGEIAQVAGAVRAYLGALAAVEFLVERLEGEPEWMKMTGYNSGWSRLGDSLAEGRKQANPTGALEERLLKLVTAELRRDLKERRNQNRLMYSKGHSYFWSEKAADFRAVAESVWGENRTSGAAVLYVAQYIWQDLNEYDRAIDMLGEAHSNGRLDENGQSTFVGYLHSRSRYDESIPVLAGLIRQQPDAVGYRTLLMTAQFRAGRLDDLGSTLAAADKYYHEGGRWRAGTIAELASACVTTHLHANAVKYYDELIPLHKRSAGGQVENDGTLSNYYLQLAEAHISLGNSIGAVEAASGSIVAWGRDQRSRQNALGSLVNVLRRVKDLEAYVAHLDKQVAESGLENPILRKAVGTVYLEKNLFKEALHHLTLAVEVQPNDRETHDALVQAYDRLGDKAGALARVLAAIDLSRRDIGLYRDLGQRYAALGDAAQAERANLSIVEMLPAESESHTMLAEILQAQGRWDEAIPQWRHVARIRALEPTGFLKLAEAQLHQSQWREAAGTLGTVQARSWPERFGDVQSTARELMRRVPPEFQKN